MGHGRRKAGLKPAVPKRPAQAAACSRSSRYRSASSATTGAGPGPPRTLFFLKLLRMWRVDFQECGVPMWHACLVLNRLALASPTAAPTATIALPRRHCRSHCHVGTAHLTRHILRSIAPWMSPDARPAPFASRPVQRTLLTPHINPWVTLSLRQEHLRAACGPSQEKRSLTFAQI